MAYTTFNNSGLGRTQATLLGLALSSFLLFTSCADDKKTVQEPISPKRSEEAKTKTPAQSRELQFFKVQNNEASPFTLEDEQYFTTMDANPKADSEAEAALAVGIVKYVLKLGNTNSNYQENELIRDDANNGVARNQVSLEALALEKQVNFPRALGSNPYLHDLQFYKLTLKALKSSNNSVEFTNSLNQTVANELKNWDKPKSDTAAIVEEVETQVSSNNWDALQEVSAEVRIGDNILLEAQTLADNRRFQDAIGKVSLISEKSPLFAVAREKVVEFSDRAVEELREKAAKAFQSAIPVSDPKSRAVYLQKAKSHLEQALQDYPNAPVEQLTTVRENLAVISRDLEKLD